MMLRRKFTMSWKDIQFMFKDMDKQGKRRLPKIAVREVLSRFAIDMTDEQFDEACEKLSVGPGGEVPYDRFMALFKSGTDVGPKTTIVRGVNRDQAIRMLRENIQARLASGPDGLRRAFQTFDQDGSGAISIEEFRVLLDRKLNLVFTEEILRQVMARFDDTGTGEIDYRKFTELVMGSKREDSTSLMTALSGRQGYVSADGGNSDMMLRRKIRMSWKQMKSSFMDLDKINKTYLSRDQVRQVLRLYDVDMSEEQFEVACSKLDVGIGGDIKYMDFMQLFRFDRVVEDSSDDEY